LKKQVQACELTKRQRFINTATRSVYALKVHTIDNLKTSGI